jgi:hypothetical protein
VARPELSTCNGSRGGRVRPSARAPAAAPRWHTQSAAAAHAAACRAPIPPLQAARGTAATEPGLLAARVQAHAKSPAALGFHELAGKQPSPWPWRARRPPACAARPR